MDPVTLILTALASGAKAALTDTAGQLIKDAYAGLKSLVIEKLGAKAKRSEAEYLVSKLETSPDATKLLLEEELKKLELAKDSAIVEASNKVLALTDKQGMDSGKYKINIIGDPKSVIIGDDAVVNVTINQ